MQAVATLDIMALLSAMVVLFVIEWIVGAFFLWIGLKLVGTSEEKMEFFSIMITSLIAAILMAFIPFIGCILDWWVIKIRHTDEWGKAIVAWLLWLVIPLAISYAIILMLGLPFLYMP